MALAKEMQTVIDYQETCAELNGELFKLLRRAVEYYEKQGLEIPDRQHFNRLMDETRKILEKRAGMKNLIPDGSYHGDESDAKLPEPIPIGQT